MISCHKILSHKNFYLGILFFLVVVEPIRCFGQDGGYYLLEYQAGGVRYNTFAVDSGNGRGLMRVSYKVFGQGNILVEQKTIIKIETVKNRKGVSSERLVLTGIDPVFIGKRPSSPYFPDIIALKRREKDGLYMPDFVYTDFEDGRVFGVIRKFQVIEKNSEKLKTVISQFQIKSYVANSRPINPSVKSTIHLVLLTNSEDGPLGSNFSNNHVQLKNLFKDVSTILKMDMKVTEIIGEKFNKQTVESKLKFDLVENRDILVFYYSGHGYCHNLPPPDTMSIEKWPAMILTNSAIPEEIHKSALKLKDVYELLVGKSARLTLVVGECCNIVLPGSNKLKPKKVAPALTAGGFAWNPLLVTSLFSRTEKILVATSRPTEFTVYDDELDPLTNTQRGYGYFCRNFINELNARLSMESVDQLTWKHILTAAATKTTLDVSEKSLDQHAMIHITP